MAEPESSFSLPGKILEAVKLLLQRQQGLDSGEKCGEEAAAYVEKLRMMIRQKEQWESFSGQCFVQELF